MFEGDYQVPRATPVSKEARWDRFVCDYQEIFQRFLQNHGIADSSKLRPWQQAYLNLPLEKLTGAILELPPGAGKTITSIWVIIIYLLKFWGKRVIFAVPLRMLAKQQALDIQRDLDLINEHFGLTDRTALKVAVAEGPGARVDLINNSVIVATYEHAGGELRRNPEVVEPAQARRWISLVIVDEIHEVAKDRGLAVDDVLYFSKLRVYSRTHGTERSRFPHVIGMSGTLVPWQQARLLGAYETSIFPNGVYSLENLACLAGASCPSERIQSAGAKRVFLKLDKQPAGYIPILREILSRVCSARDDGAEIRLVVFLDTVRSVELAYYAMSTSTEIIKNRRYPVAPIGLKTSGSELNGMLKDTGLRSFRKVKEAIRCLQQSGIYIHHAQLKDSPDSSGKDLIEAQLGGRGEVEGCPKDFVAVFSTSTLAVGINLAPTQVGFLGPNTLWTVDKAEQMIGRVGRSPQDVGRSVVFVTESVKYLAPGISAVFAPTEWFAARMLSAMEFGAAGRIKALKSEGGEIELYEANLDIRGFLSPSTAGELSVADIPANGLIPLARSWGLLDENLDIKQEARAALILSRMDPRNLPVTMDLVEAPSKYLSWRVILLWSLLLVGYPTGWERFFKNKQIGIQVPQTNFLLTDEDILIGSRLLTVYGQTHEEYPGDEKIPSSKTFEGATLLWSNLVWALGVDGSAWVFGGTLELIDLLMKLISFVRNLKEDINPFYQVAPDNLVRLVDEISVTLRFLKASAVLFKAAYDEAELPATFEVPYRQIISEHSPELEGLLNRSELQITTSEAVSRIHQSLVEDLQIFT